jgi:hypothetical protein
MVELAVGILPVLSFSSAAGQGQTAWCAPNLIARTALPQKVDTGSRIFQPRAIARRGGLSPGSCRFPLTFE